MEVGAATKAAKLANIPAPASDEQLTELELLEAEDIRLTRELALKSTWHMATKVLWPDVAHIHYWEGTHKDNLDWWDDPTPGDKKAMGVFREYRKTILHNVAYQVRMLCNDFNIRVMTISANQKTSFKMMKLLKSQFVGNASFKKHFPEFAIDDVRWGAAEEATHPLRTATGLLDPTFCATYLGAPLISRRADVIVLDDPVDEDHVANPDLAANVMASFNELSPILDKTSSYRKMRFIGTPKSYNDPLAAISGEMEGVSKDSKGLVAGWEVLRHAVLEDEKGEPSLEGKPLLPNVHTNASVKQILEECKVNPKQGESYFWREYMCKVQAPGEAKFEEAWFVNWVDDLPPNIVKSYIAIDSALKDEQVLFRGDFMVYLTGHFDNYGHLYLTDGARSDAWKSKQAKEELVSMAQRGNGISNIVKEKVGEGGSFGQIKDWFSDARMPCTMYPVKVRGMGKKVLRVIDLAQGPLMAGKVHFVKGFPRDIWKVLVNEAVHIGMWSHDDAIDCFSLFFVDGVKISANKTASVKWVVPKSRILQVGTSRNNLAAVAASQRIEEGPNDRLLPGGESDILKVGKFSTQPAGVPFSEEEPWYLKT